MDIADLLLAYLQWHFSDFDGDFHIGSDVLVEDAEERRDGLAVTLLLANGERKTVVLTAKETE